jgi:hypothetical protein
MQNLTDENYCNGATWWCSLLRHCATSRKVAGSIPDCANGILHWHKPPGRTLALGSNQPLLQLSTKNISSGLNAASAYGWQHYQLHVPIVLISGSLNLLEPSGRVQACTGIAVPLRFLVNNCNNYTISCFKFITAHYYLYLTIILRSF